MNGSPENKIPHLRYPLWNRRRPKISPFLKGRLRGIYYEIKLYFHLSRYPAQAGMSDSPVYGYYPTLLNVIKTLPPIIRTAPSMIFLSILSEPFMKAKAKRSVKSGEVLAKGLATTTGNNFKAP